MASRGRDHARALSELLVYDINEVRHGQGPSLARMHFPHVCRGHGKLGYATFEVRQRLYCPNALANGERLIGRSNKHKPQFLGKPLKGHGTTDRANIPHKPQFADEQASIKVLRRDLFGYGEYGHGDGQIIARTHFAHFSRLKVYREMGCRQGASNCRKRATHAVLRFLNRGIAVTRNRDARYGLRDADLNRNGKRAAAPDAGRLHAKCLRSHYSSHVKAPTRCRMRAVDLPMTLMAMTSKRIEWTLGFCIR